MTITVAYIPFVTDEVKSAATAVTISAPAHEKALTFTNSKRNISSQAKTSVGIAS